MSPEETASVPKWVERVRPSRSEGAEIVSGVGLTVLGLIGFRTSFGGLTYLLIGFAGAVLGACVAHLLARARLPLLVSSAVALAVLLGCGSTLVTRGGVLFGAIPTPGSVVSFIYNLVHGWARLLAIEPPAGNGRELLVIPFACGYVGALGSVLLALKMNRWPACLVPPLGVLAISVLFGLDQPASLVLQGGVFGAAAIAWMSEREKRRRPVLVDTGRTNRLVSSLALLMVIAAGALLAGPRLPLAKAHDRYVLRDHTTPPFDLSREPSPLVALRRYIKNPDKLLFEVMGLTGSEPVRLAVLDNYDGSVWAVDATVAKSSGQFERFGQQISDPASTSRDLVFTIKDLPSQVWMPVAGEVSAVTFAGPRAKDLRESFRFSRDADAAVIPVKLGKDDTYAVRSTDAHVPAGDTVGQPKLEPDPVIAAKAAELAGIGDERSRVTKLATELRDGVDAEGKRISYYSDGGSSATNGGRKVSTGHSLARLSGSTGFLTSDVLVGNSEQYAATMALMARSLGVRARVVMGFRASPGEGSVTDAPESDPKWQGDPVQVRGGNVEAWVEVAIDGKWAAFYPTPSKSRVPPPILDIPTTTTTTTTPAGKASEQPNPAKAPKPRIEDSVPQRPVEPPRPGRNRLVKLLVRGAELISLPALAILAACGLVVFLKAGRRRRRRSVGRPATRIAGAWYELVDKARDLGDPVPHGVTRSDAAVFVNVPGAIALAGDADAAVFGSKEPSAQVALQYWQRVDAALRTRTRQLSPRSRLLASVSLTSLLEARRLRRSATTKTEAMGIK